MYILFLLVSSLAYTSFLQEEEDVAIVPVFSSVLTYTEMKGDMVEDQIAELFKLTLITPSEDAEGLTWSDIENEDDEDDLADIAEDSDNPDTVSLTY
ncbi:hypothetical protein SteCoe_14928 [Stentor coeruleus]|uniref:Uncharacterized protein n=1 Tax=Stentor coeruleus TaxID=5963 RepID=A0A1R2C4S1_9CILI|nr:hypothetical protein SteCoe_14928 [Stentor coeruleus]